jgi:hypothetical protein
LSPFANLFAQQVGNVLERYQVSESACEMVLEKFVELQNSTTKNLKPDKQFYESGII